jgi:hypothetical protein
MEDYLRVENRDIVRTLKRPEVLKRRRGAGDDLLMFDVGE